MNIYVGNIPFEATEDEIREMFESYGTVTAMHLIIDRFTKRPRGFGFIEMDNDQEAQEAIDGLNGSELMGRTLQINEARSRESGGSWGGLQDKQNRWSR